MDPVIIIIIIMSVVLVFGSYIVTSLLLFKFPNFIHKRKQLKFICKHISHRGGAGENLENTITAYKHAAQMGTDMLEIDLQLTKDGEVVVSHDNHLMRTAGVDAKISDLDYQDLPLLHQSLPVDFANGRICVGSGDRSIPLLKDVFKRFPSMPINIDIKTDNDLLIKKVSQMICEYNREEYTVWGNFSNTVTKKCYKENPDIPILFSATGVLKLLLLTYSGLLPFVPLKESCLETFMPSVFLRKDSDALKGRRVLKMVIWLAEKLLMRKAIFNHLDKRGIQTYLWVLNTDADYERAFKLGATGVMTDYPTLLKEFLEKNPQYR